MYVGKLRFACPTWNFYSSKQSLVPKEMPLFFRFRPNRNNIWRPKYAFPSGHLKQGTSGPRNKLDRTIFQSLPLRDLEQHVLLIKGNLLPRSIEVGKRPPLHRVLLRKIEKGLRLSTSPYKSLGWLKTKPKQQWKTLCQVQWYLALVRGKCRCNIRIVVCKNISWRTVVRIILPFVFPYAP